MKPFAMSANCSKSFVQTTLYVVSADHCCCNLNREWASSFQLRDSTVWRPGGLADLYKSPARREINNVTSVLGVRHALRPCAQMLFFPLQVCATSAVIRKQMIHHHANRLQRLLAALFHMRYNCSAMKIARIITMLGNKRHHKTGRIGIPPMAVFDLIRRKSMCFQTNSCTIASRLIESITAVRADFCYFDHALSIGSTTISSPPPATGRPYDACKRIYLAVVFVQNALNRIKTTFIPLSRSITVLLACPDLVILGCSVTAIETGRR